jgi:hypothetical protein
MRVDVYLPLLISLLLGVVAPPLARRLPPATAGRALVAAALVSAVSTAYALALLTWTLLAQIRLVAWLGGWSLQSWDDADPVPTPVAVGAALALGVAAVRLARTTFRHRRAMAEVRRVADDLDGGLGDLVVIDEVRPEAFALPARRGGRVVVSTGMLNALSPDERRVLLAHEHAHLAHRHHLCRALAEAAAAVNPLLYRLPQAVGYATERWADEEAASAVGDRALAARALARAALASLAASSSPTASAMGYHSSDVPERVRSLLSPRPRRRPVLLAVLAALAALTLWAPLDANQDAESLLVHSGAPIFLLCAPHCPA